MLKSADGNRFITMRPLAPSRGYRHERRRMLDLRGDNRGRAPCSRAILVLSTH